MTDERRSDDERTRQIAREAATEAVLQTLRTLGIDVDDPLEAQRDAALLRTLRKAKDRGMIVFITTVGGVILLAAWDWIKNIPRMLGWDG